MADKQAFRVFLPRLGPDTNLTRITRRQVEQALANIAQTVSRTSANTWFRHFKAALSKAKEWGYLKVNPCLGIKPLRVQAAYPRFLTEEEFARLLAAEPDPLFRLFWQFQVYSGARRRESLGITAKDIRLDLNRIDLGRTKNGHPKAIILNDHLREILAVLNVQVGKLWPWQTDSVTHHFHRTARAAGLQCRLHDLRHTYGSWLVMKGVPLYTVGKLMGTRIKRPRRFMHIYPKITSWRRQQNYEKYDSFLLRRIVAFCPDINPHGYGGRQFQKGHGCLAFGYPVGDASVSGIKELITLPTWKRRQGGCDGNRD